MVLSKERTRRAWQPGERAVVVRDQCDLGEGFGRVRQWASEGACDVSVVLSIMG